MILLVSESKKLFRVESSLLSSLSSAATFDLLHSTTSMSESSSVVLFKLFCWEDVDFSSPVFGQLTFIGE